MLEPDSHLCHTSAIVSLDANADEGPVELTYHIS